MNMIKTLLLSLFFATASLSAAVEWKTDYQGALKEAKASGKPVVLFFTGSDWCSWCTKLEHEALDTSDFAEAAGSSFIFVELDYPRGKTLDQALTAQNRELKTKYGISGFPTVLIVDSNEKIIGKTGYQAGGGKAYADHLKSFIK